MNIGTFGCSFTRGFGVSDEETWSHMIEAKNWGASGSSNDMILERVLKFHNKFDTIIVCWSNPVRTIITKHVDLGLFHYNRQFKESIDYEEYQNIKQKYFNGLNLTTILSSWQEQINTVEELGVNCIHTSAFGDVPRTLPKRWATPILTKLAPELKFNIELFEYDMLLKGNTIVQKWADRHFNKDWKLAAIERNLLRTESKNFLSCGHPSAKGHKIYAEYMKDYVSRVFP